MLFLKTRLIQNILNTIEWRYLIVSIKIENSFFFLQNLSNLMAWLYLSGPTFSLVRITVLSLTLQRRSISSTRYKTTLLARSCALFPNPTQRENSSNLLAEVSSPGKMCKRIKDSLYAIVGSAWAYTSQMNC